MGDRPMIFNVLDRLSAGAEVARKRVTAVVLNLARPFDGVLRCGITNRLRVRFRLSEAEVLILP